MAQFSEFKSCENDLPKKDGMYIIFRFVISEHLPLTYHIYTMEYTVEYGWNTSQRHHEHALKFDEGEVWCEITDFSGFQVWNLDTKKIEIMKGGGAVAENIGDN